MEVISRPFGVTKLQKLKNGMMAVTGVIMELDKKLLNGTVYSADLWEKDVIPSYQPIMDNEMAYGMMDHPLRDYKDISTKLKYVYGRLTSLFLSPDRKFLMGTFLIYNNDVGRSLQYLLENGTVGVSTRGRGKTNLKNGTRQVIAYGFIGADFVATPSSVKALFTAKNTDAKWETLVESVDAGNLNMIKRLDLFEEVKKNAKVDVSEYFKYDEEINDNYICDMSGNCKLVTLMENSIKDIKDIEEEVVTSIEDEVLLGVDGEVDFNEVLDKEITVSDEPIIESVADMLTPVSEINLDTFDEDIVKMSREEIIANHKKILFEREADKLLALPRGKFLRKIFIAMTQSNVPSKTIGQVITIFNTELASGSEASDIKVEELTKALSEKTSEVHSLANQVEELNKSLESVKAELEDSKSDKNKTITELKERANKQIQVIASKADEKTSELQNKLSAVKENQQVKVAEIKRDINATKDVLNQYYSLMEDKNEVIESYKKENNMLKNELDGMLTEVGNLTESYNEIKGFSETLMEDRILATDNFSTLSHEIKEYKENMDLFKEKVDILKEAKIKAEKEKEEVLSDLQMLQNNFKVTEGAVKRNLDNFNAEKAKMAEEMTKQVAFISEYKKLLNKAELKEQKYIEQKEELLAQSNESIQVIAEMEGKLDIISENFDKELQEKANIEKIALELKDKHERLAEENERLAEAHDSKVESLLEATDYISKLKERNDKIASDNSNLQVQLEIMREKLDRVKSKYSDNSFRSNLFSKADKINDDLNLKINIKEEDIESSTSALETLYENVSVIEYEDDITVGDDLDVVKSKKVKEEGSSFLETLKRSKLDLIN